MKACSVYGGIASSNPPSKRLYSIVFSANNKFVNKLFLGDENVIFDNLPKRDFLLLHDEIPDLPHSKVHAQIFEPKEHHFNPLRQIDYHYACDFVDFFSALNPGGENTLTKAEGLDIIAEALDDKPKSLPTLIRKPDKKSTPGHIWAYSKLQRLLRSPVLNRVLCEPGEQFSFNPETVILARINRRELGDYDALALGLLLMMQFKGQEVVTHLGFIGRDNHVSLIREERLMAHVSYLDQLTRKAPELREAVLSIDIEAHGARFTDAHELAINAGLRPDPARLDKDIPYNDYIEQAMR